MWRKIRAPSLMAALLTLLLVLSNGSVLAQSSIDQDINQMFQKWGLSSNVTMPGAYNAQSRGMITGGSLSMRVQQMQPPLVTFSPPQFNIGCGGIDFFFGGLSFLNGKSAVNWVEHTLEGIAMGAIAYGFHTALDAVCSTCNTQLKHIAQTIQQWQKMMSDSCQLGKAIASAAWTPSAQMEGQMSGCVQSCEAGQNGDPPSCSTSCNSGTSTSGSTGNVSNPQSLWDQVVGSKFLSQAGAGAAQVQTPGNALWDALSKVQGYTDDQRVTVQSLIGTFLCYIPPPPGGSNSGPVPVRCDYTGHSIQLKDFLYGNQSAQCIMNKDDLSDYSGNAPPAVNYQPCAINGYLPLVTNQVTSIVNDLKAGNLSDNDKNFIATSNVPIEALVETTQGSKDLQGAAIDMTSDLIAIVMAVEQVKGYIRIAENSVSQQTEVDAAQMQARIDDVKRELYEQVAQEFLLFNSQFRTYELVDFFDKQIKKQGSPAMVKAAGNMKASQSVR